ncbi:glutathione S-transferase family protein [Pelomonas sp. KK5]|uniref:glutathione S-transferase family protein n=1 Tax=Pelomonas sp. KK5 TaxID=1855730 RepID=UPI00097C4F33|nr:glutathione S-transferase [Pelomonas sp. KK5]
MYTLYGTRGSGSAAIEAALEWAAEPFDRVDAASWIPGEGTEALKRINPMAQIPTLLLPDGSILTESAAILIHLGLALPRSGLLPEDASARAQAIRGLVFIAANCYSAISVIDFPERWHLDADDGSIANVCIQRGARHRLHLHWDAFAAQTPAGASGFLLGRPEPGALDLLAAVVSRWSGARQHLQHTHAELHALLLRVDTHPRLAAVFERHWPTQPS